MIRFDDGTEADRTLDGQLVAQIHADLTSLSDVTKAAVLQENRGLCFLGVMKAGPFDIDSRTALSMLSAPQNPNGRYNSDVVKRRMSGREVATRPGNGWVIDFVEMAESEAALYEKPFEYVRIHVKPVRDENRDVRMKAKWWLHGRSRPALREALGGLTRCIVTPEVAKHRIFIWMSTDIVPDHKLHVFAREDSYFFGVLHSRVHRVWSLAQCAWLGVGNDPSYSSSTTFETFPFPGPPRTEPGADPRVKAIALATEDLVTKRDRWLNPEGATETDLKARTLTILYNQSPTWLQQAHRALDHAVSDAYGWEHDLSDDQILERLLTLNLRRSGS